MRIIFLNQTFYPDVASSGQHLRDVALRLADGGHTVTVITSCRAYDDPTKQFARRETWRGIRIVRLFASGFGKRSRWRRAVDFATFMASCCWRLSRLPPQDLVVAMTSPPLISYVAAWFTRLRGIPFCYWIMDLNPDEALAAGWLSAGSPAAGFLERCSRFSLRRATRIIVLDRFMRDRVLSKGISPKKILIIPPWSHDAQVRFDLEGRRRFRSAHGLAEKYVVMYSGNHSPCHPLDTVLAAAKELANHADVRFCFVGGGSEFARVQRFALDQQLSNILCLPYQPLEELAGTLSGADLHLVVMGNRFVGIVHPCKIYNILRVGSPLVCIGPGPSHISEILDELGSHLPCARVEHGDVAGLVSQVQKLQRRAFQGTQREPAALAERFGEQLLLSRLVDALESLVDHDGAATGQSSAKARRLQPIE